MLTITPKAQEKIRFYLQGKDAHAWGVRIEFVGGQFDFSLDEIASIGDAYVVETIDGINILLARGHQHRFEGATVDFVESSTASGFHVEFAEREVPDAILDLTDPITRKINDLLESDINPAIAAHGGVAKLVGYKDGYVFLQLGGGCQGCAASQMTLKQGIESRLREAIPEVKEIVDQTDHASGTNPYYS